MEAVASSRRVAALPHVQLRPRREVRRRDTSRGLSHRVASHGTGCREAPTAVDQCADAETVRLLVADTGHLALTGADVLAAIATNTHVGVRRPSAASRVEGERGEVESRRVRGGSRQRLRAEGLVLAARTLQLSPRRPPWSG